MNLQEYYDEWKSVEPARRQMKLLPIIERMSSITIEDILRDACKNVEYIQLLNKRELNIKSAVFSLSKMIEKIYKFVPSNKREQIIKDQCMQRAIMAMDNIQPPYIDWSYLDPEEWVNCKVLPLEHSGMCGAFATFGL